MIGDTYDDSDDAPKVLTLKRTRKPRREHDAYPTVDELALAICRRLSVLFPSPNRLVEPTAGAGAFVRAARQVWPDAVIAAVDLVEEENRLACEAAGAKFIHADAREINYFGADLVLGNPPFSLAAPILRRIRETAPAVPIAFLLPVGFAGRTKGRVRGKADPALRRDAYFWRLVERTYSAVLHPRPSFSEDGRTDSMEYELTGFGAEGWHHIPPVGILDEPIVWRPE